MKKDHSTSWQSVNKWYETTVGELGHYYHQHIVIPGAIKLLDLSPKVSCRLLDLACGQGVLARHLPEFVYYHGVDQSPSLIKAAKQHDRLKRLHFTVADICKPLHLEEKELFTHATILLALQNVAEPQEVFSNLSPLLQSGGRFVIVLNHPCFRIPRQSSWGIDEEQKIQYRKINRYLSPLKIPIQMHPSKSEASQTTWSFHHPISSYTQWLHKAGFVIEQMSEWASDKSSTGKNAAMENRARQEFPLFLAILAKKL